MTSMHKFACSHTHTHTHTHCSALVTKWFATWWSARSAPSLSSCLGAWPSGSLALNSALHWSAVLPRAFLHSFSLLYFTSACSGGTAVSCEGSFTAVSWQQACWSPSWPQPLISTWLSRTTPPRPPVIALGTSVLKTLTLQQHTVTAHCINTTKS